MAADTTHRAQRSILDSGESRDTDPPERHYTRRRGGEFMLTLAPLLLRNVTRSPVNPVALY